MNETSACPFCQPRTDVFYESPLALGIWGLFPVAEGHALLITRRHVADWFDATTEERADLAEATLLARLAIQARFGFDGINLGVNIGEAAGQTVPHLHLHV